MEFGMFAAGLTSLALGGAMTLFASNVIRQNRRREAARTVLLSQMAFPGAIDDFPRESPVAAEPLFTKPDPLGAVSRRTAALAAITLAAAFAIGAMYGLATLDARPAAVPSAAPAADAVVRATTVSVPSPVQTPPRLELLALTHRATPATFLVTGQVRNPAGGAPLNDIVAVVEVMDDEGRVLTTMRAPLARPEPNAGEVWTFSATASKATDVARYRVEFQNTAHALIPHVDRRRAA